MGFIIKYFGFFLLFSLFSCDKGDFKPDYTRGKATAIMNGKFWIGQARGFVNNQGIGVNMSFEVHDNLGQRRQNLSFRKIPLLPGDWELFNTSGQSKDSLSGCSFVTLSFDGDVVEDRYRVSESERIITVLHYDEAERIISGKFKIKLHIDPDRKKANPNNPDTILFEMGEFEVRIEE